MTIHRYVTLVAFFTLILLVSVATINYFINPYLVFTSPRIEGINAIKADISNYIRQAKTYHPLNQKIDTLLVGNSRIEMGFNPTHRCLSSATYNLGIPGASVEMQVAFALNVLRQNDKVERVIMSLDFTDFIQEKGRSPRSNFSYGGQDSLLFFIDGQPNPDYWFHQLKDKYMALLSLDVTTSSIKTLLLQRDSSANRTEQGFNPALELANSTQVEGPHRIFEHTKSMLKDILHNKAYEPVSFEANVNFRALQAIIDYTKANSIKLTLFVNPLHDSFYQIIDEAELNDDLTMWKTDINAFVAKNQLGEHFYDFGKIEGITDEPYPTAKQVEPLSWFWEPAHYNEKLGDKLIRSMTPRSCSAL
ncbi:hypothetical protein KUL17_13070 [Alteromonas sp. KUL17]|uniref:hypothetical protein n=1 Tax=Alteromonas sp. KUL17 TaxID=2480796 RepID=UPI0010374D0D|nr:hypothetical protein [Alteromonas sp. KUL17]TAP29481.1 hypothetical protein KUL49_06515 [Alteromonas sp. KUL17]GEA02410.1 hypothetical protein KUL17_13070 [Alteromonas sp. KUL17]